MELPMIREACLRVLVLCTVFLKEAVSFGLCLAEIGEMMTREFRGGEEEPSELERVCIGAMRLTAERELSSPKNFPKAFLGDDEFLFDLDCEEPDPETDFTQKVGLGDFATRMTLPFGVPNGFGRSLLSKLEEAIIEEDEDDDREEAKGPFSKPQAPKRAPSISKLSMSMKNTSLDDKVKKFPVANPPKALVITSSSGHRSANEQLPSSPSFFKLADIHDEDWAIFLETFQELLGPAFAERRAVTSAQKQLPRLGTSCKF
uniref:1-phosphatidylinositol 4-kinase n=1 Tax=Kalanchoe fedtschenkoi TaxID=63787 RepID=A0A7N0VAI0_KALFE